MIELLNYGRELVASFHVYAKEYPFLAGGVGLWLIGIFSYLLKDLHNRVISFIKRTFSTTLTIMNTTETYYDFIKWYSDKGYANHGRYLKITNGVYGDGKALKSLGEGRHYFFFNYHLVILDMSTKQVQGFKKEIDQVRFTVFGRSHDTFDKLITMITSPKDEKIVTKIKHYRYDSWYTLAEQPPRGLNTIFFKKRCRKPNHESY